jgi:hypothetical protein
MTQPSPGDVEGLSLINLESRPKNLSFDIWDTLIGRIYPAEAVKRRSALITSFREWEARKFEGPRISAEEIHERRLRIESKAVRDFGEAELSKVHNEINKELGLNPEERFHLQEIEHEIKITEGLPNALAFINKIYKDSPENTHLISDFYVTGSGLSAITASNGIPVKNIYSSADYGQTKRDRGLLFTSIIPGEARTEWLHVGDNRHSDGTMAELHGIASQIVTRTKTTSWNGHDLDLNMLVDDLAEQFKLNDAGLYLMHKMCLAYSVITFAIEKATELQLKKIAYVSREGETLSNLHTQLIEMGILEHLPELEVIHLPFGRAAVFGPSYGRNLEAALKTVSYQYPIMDSRALSETLALSKTLDDKIKIKLGPLKKYRTSSIIGHLGVDLASEISDFLNNQKVLLEGFLNEQGIDPSNTLISDLGWRGTIQDSLSRIASREFHGAYLAAMRPFSPSEYTKKYGLIKDEFHAIDRKVDLNFIGPIERSYISSNWQTLRINKNSQGEYGLDLAPDPDGPSSWRNDLESTYSVEFLQKASETMFNLGLFGRETAEFAASVVSNWLEKPTAAHASVWFDEAHKEGFGVGQEAHYSNILPNPSWIGPYRMRAIKSAVQWSRWPQGYSKWLPIYRKLKGNNVR